MAYPVIPVKLPADLVGVPNGQLTTQLVPVKFAGRGTLKVHKQYARAWNALVAECFEATGIVLTAVSAGDAYRSFDSQELVFYARYTTTPVAGTTSIKSYKGQTWYLKKGLAQVATPGQSNHGLGLAVDVAEWTGTGVKSITSSAAWVWFLTNAVSFGFSWELQSEAWHIRLVVGDKPTQRVLDYEDTPDPPVPPVYDVDMGTLYRDVRFNNVFLVNGDVTTVGGVLYASLRERGVPLVEDLHDQSLISFMRKSQIKTGQLVVSATPGPFDAPADLVGV